MPCGLASVERLAPQIAAVELDQFGSLSLVVRAFNMSQGKCEKAI